MHVREKYQNNFTCQQSPKFWEKTSIYYAILTPRLNFRQNTVSNVLWIYFEDIAWDLRLFSVSATFINTALENSNGPHGGVGGYKMQMALREGFSGHKIWTPLYSVILTPDLSNETKKSILANKSYGITRHTVLLWYQVVDIFDQQAELEECFSVLILMLFQCYFNGLKLTLLKIWNIKPVYGK